MYASNPHSYTLVVLGLGIVSESTLWGFVTSQYSGIHDIGWANEKYVCVLRRCSVVGVQDFGTRKGKVRLCMTLCCPSSCCTANRNRAIPRLEKELHRRKELDQDIPLHLSNSSCKDDLSASPPVVE